MCHDVFCDAGSEFAAYDAIDKICMEHTIRQRGIDTYRENMISFMIRVLNRGYISGHGASITRVRLNIC